MKEHADMLLRHARARATRPEAIGPRHRGGFTLIEAVISMAIVAFMLVAALNTLGGAARSWQVRENLHRGPNLARQLMTEIVQARFEEPVNETVHFGVEQPGESPVNRSNWDDVDDYDGWWWSPLLRKDGEVVPNTQGWTREVTVQNVAAGAPSIALPAGTVTGLKLITVTVTAPNGRESSVAAFRSRLGSYEQSPTSDTTYVSWVGAELQIGGDPSHRVSAASNLLNNVIDGGGG